MNSKGAIDKMECVESRFELLALGGREEDAIIEEEKSEREVDKEEVRERKVILTVEGNLAEKDDEIEVLRGLDGINDLPRSELYDDDSFEDEGSVVLSEGDVEMPTLEDLVVEDTLSEGDSSLDGDEELILPSQLREFLFEDEEVIMVEGGWRRSGLPEDENDVWEYVNHEAIEAGEQPVLGVGVFDRVIWARGTPINMVRVRLALERIERVRVERRLRVREVESFWAEDQSLLVVEDDGMRVISNTSRVLRNNVTGVLGTFRDDVIVERMQGGIVGREEGAIGGIGGEEGERGRNDRVIYPTPIEVIGICGSRCNLFDPDGLMLDGMQIDALVREREDITLSRGGESTTSSTSGEEDDSGTEFDLPPGGDKIH